MARQWRLVGGCLLDALARELIRYDRLHLVVVQVGDLLAWHLPRLLLLRRSGTTATWIVTMQLAAIVARSRRLARSLITLSFYVLRTLNTAHVYLFILVLS